MPNSRPPYLPGHYYHFYNRGQSRMKIFHEPENYAFVIRKIKYYATSFDITVIAYCLMPNHYHFLVRQNSENPAGLLPQRVFNSYSKAYNLRYGRHGTLFEGHFQVKMIVKNTHLLHLCRYIHANPQKDNLVENVADWPYSNYLEWVGVRKGTLIDPEFVRDNFQTPQEYKIFVQDGLEFMEESISKEG